VVWWLFFSGPSTVHPGRQLYTRLPDELAAVCAADADCKAAEAALLSQQLSETSRLEAAIDALVTEVIAERAQLQWAAWNRRHPQEKGGE
jgi:hypothetical protein